MSRIVELETEVAERRAAVMRTARELQKRLQPGKLASDAWEATKIKGADLAEDAVDAVRKRPVAATSAVAALALFFAREPVKDGISALLSKKKDRKGATRVEEADKPKAATRPKAPAKPRAPRAGAKPAAARARKTTRKATT